MAEEWARQEAILTAEIEASGDRVPPDDASLGELAGSTVDSTMEEPFPWGVITHGPGGPGGAGFKSGSVLDNLSPGPVLAGALQDTCARGLTGLSDDELAGVILAWRRCESYAAAGMLAAVAELHRRRLAHPDPHVGEHAGDELAILLTLTGYSAAGLLDQALALSRLPATMAALSAGRIDRGRAAVIGYETGLLDDSLAAAVEQLVIEDAPAQTTARLRARLRRAVLAADPEAARRRKERAIKDARVELHAEMAGTAALAGRDLPLVAALAADTRIDAQARALKAGGAAATLAQLRAAVFLGLLTGQEATRFLPGQDPDDGSDGSGDAAGEATLPPGDPVRATQPRDDRATAPDPGAQNAGNAAAAKCSPAGSRSPVGPGGGLVARGSVHLTVPLNTWLGLSDSPGEILGYGLVDAGTSRDLAGDIAATRGSRWCLTITGPAGRAIAHACARRPPPAGPGGPLHPPGPPGSRRPGDMASWLGQLKLSRIEAVTCSHAREVPGYRIPDSLHHLVKTR
ncbi:MAG TPA: DUF222 domain-containing protein [Streptosporangiaceae bacterium]|nr:DUF222 domain-containing protein [Streptosporangiaceae bacterium]